MNRSIHVYWIIEVIHFVLRPKITYSQLQKPLLYTATLAEPDKIPNYAKNYIENRVSVLIRYYFFCFLCFIVKLPEGQNIATERTVESKNSKYVMSQF